MSIVWPSRVNDQKAVISDLYSRLLAVEKSSLVGTYLGETPPSDSDLLDAFAATSPENVGLPVDAKVQWFDPSLDDDNGGIKNLYGKINDVGLGLSSQAIYPLMPRLEPYGWQVYYYEKLTADASGYNGNNFLDVSSIQKNLIAYDGVLRSDQAAATGEFYLRINDDSTAVYTMQEWRMAPGGAVAQENFDQNRWINDLVPADQSDRTQAMLFFGFLTGGNPSNFPNYSLLSVEHSGDPPGSRYSHIRVGIYQTAGVLNNVQFSVASGNARKASTLCVWYFLDSELP